jgi:hypothetical protein
MTQNNLIFQIVIGLNIFNSQLIELDIQVSNSVSAIEYNKIYLSFFINKWRLYKMKKI